MLRAILFSLFAFFGLASCQQGVSSEVPEVLNSYPHDPEAFTQGLLLFEGKLYESTGLNGRSSLREVDLTTGEVVRILPIDRAFFAEGLAQVNDKLIQLTWRSGRAFVYDLATFNRETVFTYDTEGWGLCFDDEHLYMSDGSSNLYKRDAETFELLDQNSVTLSGEPVIYLNELECVGDYVYANIWQTDDIVKIAKATGKVVSKIDASALFPASERANLSPDAVLNGIAYNPETDSFYVTGKLWPKLFEVRFVEE